MDVWQLLAETYRLHGVKATLLERDFNYPPVDELLAEVNSIHKLQLNAGFEPQLAVATKGVLHA